MIARTRTPELTWIPLPSSGMDLGERPPATTDLVETPWAARATRNHRPGRDFLSIPAGPGACAHFVPASTLGVLDRHGLPHAGQDAGRDGPGPAGKKRACRLVDGRPGGGNVIEQQQVRAENVIADTDGSQEVGRALFSAKLALVSGLGAYEDVGNGQAGAGGKLA